VPGSVRIRLLAAVVALAAGAVAVAIVAARGRTVLRSTQSAPPAPVAAAPAEPGFPAPPANAVVFSREDGADALALAVVPGKELLLQASVVDGEGNGVRGLRIAFAVGATSARAAACGPGCYRASLRSRGTPRTVLVTAPGTRWRVALPRPWPPPGAQALVERAARVWRALRSVSYSDRLGSDERHVAYTRWTVVAPDRLAYRVRNGPAAVVIGARRWDRLPGGAWRRSVQDPPLRQPLPFWAAAADAHLLGSTTFAGRPVWRISFFDPKTPAWFEILVDRETFHTLDLRMTTTAHFMHDTYGQFDAPLRIEPPSN
jgi:hypothetical protein